jgi:hypothetical protein
MTYYHSSFQDTEISVAGYFYVLLFTPYQRIARAHTQHAHTPNQELHMRPHLARFYHNDTLLYCFL